MGVPMKIYRYLAVILFLIFTAGHLQAATTVVCEHTGANDPTTEGWIYRVPTAQPSGSVTTGYIFNDQGFDAWYVNDLSTALYTTGTYQYALTQGQVDAAQSGWELSTTIKTIGISTGYYPYTMHVNYQDGNNRFLMYFGRIDGDRQFVRLYTGFEQGIDYIVDGGSYHSYSLIYDPEEGSADLFIDGIERISDYTGFATTGPAAVSWGAGASNATGQGNFNLVQWSVVPVPGAAWLFGIGLAALIRIRRRY